MRIGSLALTPPNLSLGPRPLHGCSCRLEPLLPRLCVPVHVRRGHPSRRARAGGTPQTAVAPNSALRGARGVVGRVRWCLGLLALLDAPALQGTVSVHNDALAALCSGTGGELDGCVIIAGTGATTGWGAYTWCTAVPQTPGQPTGRSLGHESQPPEASPVLSTARR